MKLADGRKYTNVAVDLEKLQVVRMFTVRSLPGMTPSPRRDELASALDDLVRTAVVGANNAPWLPALQAGEAAIKETADNASVHYDKNALLAIVGMLCKELRAAYGVVEKRAPIPYTLEIHQQALSTPRKTRSGLPVKLLSNADGDPCFVGWVIGELAPLQWDANGRRYPPAPGADSEFDLFVDEESGS